MGAVYRARDIRLGRDVAIKVVTESFAREETALARFEREAVSIAKLSHPNILSIFEFVEEAGRAFVVMELVEGETLRARLEHGPLPVRKATAYALQIARGLAAAHARGIVHRDLKPENVMVTHDDHVKILDFGLAKEAAPQAEISAAATRLAQTTPGTVLGTFGYMAPEQVRGLTVDHRADIFAFGAVLYEMATGRRAFQGETAADTMTAILTKEPELEADAPAIQRDLERILRRCLEKMPELRFQSASDLAFALEALSTGSGATASGAAAALAAQSARPARANLLPWAVAVVMALLAAVGWLGRGAPAAAPTFDTFTRITELAGEETAPALSPDGTTIAYAVRIADSWDIYTQRVGGRNATPILDDPRRNEGGLAFSPDGASVAFHESDTDGGIFVAGATGESVRRLTDFGFHPSWSPDGTRIAFSTEEIFDPSSRLGDAALYVTDVSGGQPRRVVDGDAVQPSWSPAGDRLVYWSNTTGQRDLFTVAVTGGERVALTDDGAIDWTPVWSPDGRAVYFASDRGGAMNLWRIAVDPATGRALGAPEPVTMGAHATAALPSFSKDGRRLAFRSRVSSINPFEIPFDPVTLQPGQPRLLDSRTNVRIPSAVSPDGSLVAFFNIGERQEDIFVGPPGGGTRRVLDDAARDRAPVFTPDGRSLVFYSNRTGAWQIWTIALDGSGLRQVTDLPGGVVYPVVSPAGDQLTFGASSARKTFEMPFAPGASATEVPGAVVGEELYMPQSWAADGLRVAGLLGSPSGAMTGVAVYDVVAKTVQKLTAEATYGVRWLPDSRRVLYFTNGGWDLVVADAITGARTPVALRLPAPQTTDVFAISSDGRRIYYAGIRAEADIWVLERN
jgi:Tol biopolymer transport system component